MSNLIRNALVELLTVLDRNEIHYMVGGSTASGTFGQARMTRDIDLVIRISSDDADLLVEDLQSNFYIDSGQIRDAIRYHRSFNIIHFESAFKFDLFPLTDDAYQQKQFSRRRFETSTLFGSGPVEFAVASPEDVILSKLAWYRRGREISEQQWNDVLGVIAVQGDRLDLAYMREWAGYLHIADLLEQALTEKH